MSEGEPNRLVKWYRNLNNLSHENPGIRFLFIVFLILLFIPTLAMLCSLLTRTRSLVEPTPEPIAYDPDDYFVPDQIILTAQNIGTIQTVLNRINETDEDEDQALRIIRSFTVALPQETPFCPGLPANLEGLGNFAIALVEIDRDNTSITLEEALETLRESAGITAELNLIVGSPNYPTGSTTSWPYQTAVPQDYSNQWAFQNINLGTRNLAEDGAGVRVIVFDTVPSAYERQEPGTKREENTLTVSGSPIQVDWVDQNDQWSVKVSTVQDEFGLPEPESAGENKAFDLSNHGLFVAQMVHAVAPASDVELVEVLNEDAVGNMFTLILAFNEKLFPVDGNPLATVANLSLGIRIPPPEAQEQFELSTVGVEALYTLIQLAHCRNIVVVAASGNTSASIYPPELADLPADWSAVIGVAASNRANQRACFSNQGEIAAPGGDGRMPQDPIPATPLPLGCRNRLEKCADGSCEFAVIGPIMPSNAGNNDTGETQQIGLAFWNGSSFASPLVAGLAARILAESPQLSPDDVRHIIECGATQAEFPHDIEGRPDRHIGDGVINVEKTLTTCMPPTE